MCKFFAVQEHKKVCTLCSSGLCLHTGTHHVRVRRWLQVSDPPPPFYQSSARASKNTNTTMATVSDRAHGVPYPKATRGLRNTISLRWWVGGWVGGGSLHVLNDCNIILMLALDCSRPQRCS